MYGLSGGVVLVLNHDRPAISSREEDQSIGQDGKCDQQTVEIHNRTVLRWGEPRSGYRVVVYDAMAHHILLGVMEGQ